MTSRPNNPVLRVLRTLASLRITVTCLLLGTALVFAGTLAQVEQGIWRVQKDFFESAFVYATLDSGHRVPVLPGGYLVLIALLVNLLAAFVTRFKVNARKAGVLATHTGIILIIAGEFITDLYSVESQMVLDEGQTKSYTDDLWKSELVVIDRSEPERDAVLSIPTERLRPDRTISHDALPRDIRVLTFAHNARLSRRHAPDPAFTGFGSMVAALPIPRATKTDERDVPAAAIALLPASPDEQPINLLLSQAVLSPERLTIDGRPYDIQLRPKRHHLDFAITLRDFHHEQHAGTDIPSAFVSDIDVIEDGHARPTTISMNRPLRHSGLTFYQASFTNNDRTSILQVVSNPGAAIPYIACAVIATGMAVHFLQSLSRFTSRNRRAP